MNRVFLAVTMTVICFGCASSLAQDQRAGKYTRADFINIDGGNLSDRVDRAVKQFSSSKQGDSLWIAYHFPAREGLSYGPFTGMIYSDDGIRLERKDNPATAAVFLLTETGGPRPKFTRVKTLDLSEPYVFEKRPVYWLGNAEAGESLALLQSIMTSEKENLDLARGALRALAIHDSLRIVPMLKELASKEAAQDVRAAAISNLSRIKTDPAAAALIDLYESAMPDSLKEEVIRGLARSDNRRAADKLLAIAKDDPNPKLRQQAVKRMSQSRGEAIWVN